ncbi:MAG: DUF1015 domain-containing protein [Deltaproteobacteria bacterium]|jgi:uncharacterized protein (DUF1015 family)|nr:DUF1015 domain-containing protein [Deltaproteobacteria bacterium]
MVAIAPFKGVTYSKHELTEAGGRLIAPPYDVLTPAQRAELHALHPHNFLHLDLGPVLDGDGDAMTWHARSAELLSNWLASGVLIRRNQPAIALTDTEWSHPVTGRRMTRHGMMALMRLEEPGRDSRVRPHEKTFSWHKRERLDLMRKTCAHLSPVFGFFPDPDNHVLRTFFDLSSVDPDICVTETSGLKHNVSFINEWGGLSKLVDALAGVTVYIADGHHRYETALKYRREVLAEMERNGQRPAANSAVDYIFMYLCPMSDPGLCVLPTHRVLSCVSLSNSEILTALEPYAEIKSYALNGVDKNPTAQDELTCKLFDDRRKGLTVFGLFLEGADSLHFVKIRERVKKELIRAQPQEADLTVLDVTVLTNVIFKEALGLTETDLDNPACIDYFAGIDEAFAQVRSGAGRAAFILNPASLEEIMRVTECGLIMPRKATYFFPKVSNGLVFNLVDPMESVQIRDRD